MKFIAVALVTATTPLVLVGFLAYAMYASLRAGWLLCVDAIESL